MTSHDETDERSAGGVRVFTRAPVTPLWLASYAVPAWRKAHDGGRRLAYLRRGWRFGPHVDLVVDSTAPEDLAMLAAGFEVGPAPDEEHAYSEVDYLASARELGRMEAVPPPYLPMRQHGATDLLTHADVTSGEPQLDRLRRVCAGALAAPLAASIEDLAADPSGGTRRVAEILAAMADSHALGIGYGVFSLKSHAEGFFAWTAPTTDARPVFERRYEGERDLMHDVVRERMTGVGNGVATGWRNALAYSSGVLDAAVSAGTLTAALLDGVTADVDMTQLGPPGSPQQGPTGSQPDTEFHRTVHAALVDERSGEWFAGYRLLVNLCYEQLPVLGVPPMQRYYTCYALARAVDEELGTTWQERLPGSDANADPVHNRDERVVLAHG